MRSLILFLSVHFVFSTTVVRGQTTARQDYIAEYSQIAVDEMNRSGVPASITLAQGILESANGQSQLARKSNNHFGIKCHQSWTGERVYHDDDAKGECFRKYDNAKHSFEDHSDFLSRGSRYAFLFELDPMDYKGWAHGLKKAGYATAPDYADRLIKIIEEEALYRFDLNENLPHAIASAQELSNANVLEGPVLNKKGKPLKNPKQRFVARRVFTEDTRVPYVLLKPGESIESISDSLNFPVAALMLFNDLNWESKLEAGDRLYVDQKKNRGEDKSTVVKVDETMHDISQREQIKLSKLYRINDFKMGYQPMTGDTIFLRKSFFSKKM